MLISLGGGWILYWREHNKVLDLQGQQWTKEEVAQAAIDKTPAVFEGLEGSMMYFRIPVKIELENGVFVNYEDRAALITNDTQLIQAGTNLKFKDINMGQNMSVDFYPDPQNPDQLILRAVYLQ